MSAPSFAAFYEALHGRTPFPWQEDLAERVMKDEWPPIDIPTGCGKTSVVDVAVYALAVQAHLPPGQRSPLRIFFIIDRRLVVDDVYAHAFKLAEKIESGDTAPLKWARERLNLFGGRRPLDVAVMRGGMYRSNTWADTPNQPLVCVSTVDQAGSRLLFRGYGVSPSSRPVNAALLGSDSLLIVDEAHLSKPFLQTLESVIRYQGSGWRDQRVTSGLRFVEMSATRRENGGVPHQLSKADYECEALQPRLERPKFAELKEAVKLPETAAIEAVRLAKHGVIGIVLNTVAAARATFEALVAQKRECILLTGRIRPFDRDSILHDFLPRIRADRTRNEEEQLYVVATQTVEVGADLDFDALVTEASPIDSLRQRFGRLNRLGKREAAEAVILRPKRTKEKDFIYGDSVDETWKWLQGHAKENRIDFGVRSMSDLFLTSGRANLMVEQRNAPLLFPAHLDAWAQTNPSPAVDPDVAPFLHGRDDQTADVQIVWRADLDDVGEEDPKDWVRLLDAAPPVSTEALPVPFFAARRWLQGKSSTIADIEGMQSQEPETAPETKPFLIWRGPDRNATRLSDLRPGDTIIVRSSEGGCDQFGWNPDSNAPVTDVGDQCNNARVKNSGGKYRIRLHQGVMPRLSEEIKETFKLVEDGEEIPEELRRVFKEASGADEWGQVQAYGRQGKGLLVESAWKSRIVNRATQKIVEEDEAEDGETSSITTEITLTEHTAGVVGKVRAFIGPCPTNGAAALLAAAQFHDLGKLDERFQSILSPTPKLEPLAKSAPISQAEYRRRKRDAGFPERARHEFASVLLAEQYGVWPEGCDTELALYLIGSHHGYGRPFPPIWDDGGHTIEVEMEGRPLTVKDVHSVGHLSSNWADRYIALTAQYGWWGLAYLETVLRRADCVRSREEEERQ